MRSEREIRVFRNGLVAEASRRRDELIEAGFPGPMTNGDALVMEMWGRAALLNWVLGGVEPDAERLCEYVAKRNPESPP